MTLMARPFRQHICGDVWVSCKKIMKNSQRFMSSWRICLTSCC